MEGFANKANYYLLRAAYILSLAKIIRGSPSSKYKKIPPDNDFLQQIHQNEIIKLWTLFYNNKDQYEKDIDDFYRNGADDILNLQIGDPNSFEEMIKFCFCMTGLSLKHANSDGLRKLYHYAEYGNGSVDTPETIEEKISNNEFMVAVRKTYEIQRLLDSKFRQMEGYWTAKFGRKLASQKGSQVRTKKKQRRVLRLKEKMEQNGKLTNGNFEIDRSKWERYVEEVFGYNYVSEKTKKAYRNEIEKLFSSEYNRKIQIILKK
jgi:hypothetical protein